MSEKAQGWAKTAAILAAAIAPNGIAGGIWGPGIYEDLRFALETGPAARAQQLTDMIGDWQIILDETDWDAKTPTELRLQNPRMIQGWIERTETERDRINERIKKARDD